jgi:hypothetical protein
MTGSPNTGLPAINDALRTGKISYWCNSEEIIMHTRKLLCMAIAFVLLGLSGNAVAQGRISDNDLAKLMENLKEDSKKFSDSFKQDLSKSTIRKTSEEKDAKQLADRFPKQIDGMLKQFKSKKKADAALPVVYQSYNKLDNLMGRVSPTAKTTDSWSRVKQGLDQIGKALNFTPPS